MFGDGELGDVKDVGRSPIGDQLPGMAAALQRRRRKGKKGFSLSGRNGKSFIRDLTAAPTVA